MVKDNSSKTDPMPSLEIDYEDVYKLLDIYFDQKYIQFSHQHDSFNEFIEKIIPDILTSGENRFYEKLSDTKLIIYRLQFKNIAIKSPVMDNSDDFMYPVDARRTDSTYASKIFATVGQYQDVVDVVTGEKTSRLIGKEEDNIPIAKIPIMVKSKYCNLVARPNSSVVECRYDPGGYFIIGGSEKVVMSVEKMVYRKPMVTIKKEQNNYVYQVQVDSKNYNTFVGNNQLFTMKIKKDTNIVLDIPQFKEISIYSVLKALGIETDEDITNIIVDDKNDIQMINLINRSINAQPQNIRFLNKKEATEYLMKNLKVTKSYSDTTPEIRELQVEKHLKKILSIDMLPHATTGTGLPDLDMKHKAYYIGYMIKKLFSCYLGRTEQDDRDSFINKRIELPGPLLGQLFQQFFKKMLNECGKFFKRRNSDDSNPINIISSQIKPTIIEQGIKTSLSTGAWGGSKSRKGFAQVLQRLTYMQTITYLRRVITPGVDASTNKMTSPRHLHNTQYGFFCPLETPEGVETPECKKI
jgi:DNA-directed RNA polymerase II subunit RPB2